MKMLFYKYVFVYLYLLFVIKGSKMNSCIFHKNVHDWDDKKFTVLSLGT